MAKRNAGRPTEYRKEFVEQARVACEEGGFTDFKLARLFGVKSRSTIVNWKNEHPEFKSAMQEGKDAFDSAVAEVCLMKRIRGMRYIETTWEAIPPNGELAVVKKVSKVVAPDTKAILAFLYNRNRERWSNRQDWAVSGNLIVELVNFGDAREEVMPSVYTDQNSA